MSLYKNNLKTIAYLKDYQPVYLQEHRILAEDSYITSLYKNRPIEIEQVLETYKISFCHYLNLLRLPNLELSQSSVDLNEFLAYEYRHHTISFMESSLDGLARLRKYYSYYKYQKEVNAIDRTIGLLAPKIEEIRSELATVNNRQPKSPEIEAKVNAYIKDLDYTTDLKSINAKTTEEFIENANIDKNISNILRKDPEDDLEDYEDSLNIVIHERTIPTASKNNTWGTKIKHNVQNIFRYIGNKCSVAYHNVCNFFRNIF